MPENYNHLHFKSVGSTNDLCRDECKKQLKPILIQQINRLKVEVGIKRNGKAH